MRCPKQFRLWQLFTVTALTAAIFWTVSAFVHNSNLGRERDLGTSEQAVIFALNRAGLATVDGFT